jgi:subtilisin family serine protease
MVKHIRTLARLGMVALAFTSGCDEPGDLGPSSPLAEQRVGAQPGSLDDVRAWLSEGERADILIEMKPFAARGLTSPSATLAGHDPASWRLAAAAFEAVYTDAGLKVLHRFENFPMLHAEVDSERLLDAVLADPRVAAVFPNAEVTPADVEASAVIKRTDGSGLLNPGYTGAGVSIAVLDTGLNYLHADFGSCSAGTLNTAGCKVAAMVEISPADGSLDDHSSKHGTNVAAIALAVAPGAKVIGLDVFTNGGQSGTSTAVLQGIDWVVSNRATYNIVSINMSLGDNSVATSACPGSAYASGIAAAMNAGVGVVAATGNSGHINGFSAPACEPDVISVGATYDAALPGLSFGFCSDGNNALVDRITCYSNGGAHMTMLAPGTMIAGGGVTLSGTSMASPHVAGAFAVLRAIRPGDSVQTIRERLVSTGVAITDARAGASPSGRTHRRLDLDAAIRATTCSYTLSPASVSFPHAGSTVSVSVTTDPGCTWSVFENLAWLSSASSSATMAGSGSFTVTAPHQLAGGAARSGSVVIGGATLPVSQAFDASLVETTPPDVDFLINASGDPAVSATKTTDLKVVLSFIEAKPGDTKTFCIKASADACPESDFVSFTGDEVSWTLPAGAVGARAVHITFRDLQLNETKRSRSISWDGVAPVVGRFLVRRREATQLTLGLTSVADPSGVSKVALRYTVDTRVPPADCGDEPAEDVKETSWLPATSTSFIHTGLTTGAHYAYRICAWDTFGNVAAGPVLHAMPATDLVPPRVASVTFNAGVTATNELEVKVNVTATDLNGGLGYVACMKNTKALCDESEWVPLEPDMAHTLIAGNSGRRTVYVRVRDRYLNVSAARAARIMYDVIPPAVGRVRLIPGVGQMTIALSRWKDRHSGLDRYKVVWDDAGVPADCDSGTHLAEAPARFAAYVHTGVADTTSIGYRICAWDRAGNMVAATTAADTAPPVAGFSVSGQHDAAGVAYVKRPSVGFATVTVAFAPQDGSDIAARCVSSSTTCTNWVAWSGGASPITWEVPVTSGASNVYVSYRDVWGNVGTGVRTVIVDNTPPTVGSLRLNLTTTTVTTQPLSVLDSGGSGVKRLKVVYTSTSNGNAGSLAYPASDCSTGAVVADNATGVGTHSRSAGTTYRYRICAEDNVGNYGSALHGDFMNP